MEVKTFLEFIQRGGSIQFYEVFDGKTGCKTKYDPMMLCGKTGTGKTYVAKEEAQEAREDGYSVQIVITTELVEEIVEEIKRDIKWFSVDAFITGYYNDTDMLILEDMHEIKERESTQVMLAELVIKLAEAGKQVVMTSTEGTEVLESFNDYLRTHGVREFWL